MKIIGVTGRVGSGKSEVLNRISEKYNCRIIKADDIARDIQKPGAECYLSVVSLIGADCLDSEGRIIRSKMADVIFNDERILKEINNVVHPAVKRIISDDIKAFRENSKCDAVFLESAILLESGLRDMCDETWCIFVRDEVRRSRLKASRGYSDEIIDAILSRQLSDQELAEGCDRIIDNSDDIEDTMERIGLIWQEKNMPDSSFSDWT